MSRDYCHSCNLTVAPHDREKKVYQGNLYHGDCLEREKQRNRETSQLRLAFAETMVSVKVN